MSIISNDLSFNLKSIYVKNNFSEESNVERALNSAYRIITTPLGSDFENPLFGCNIKGFVFNLATYDILDRIKENIDSSLRMFEPHSQGYRCINN
jgi:phage baseplate assembly protein W